MSESDQERVKYTEIVTLPTLDVQPFDRNTDSIVIEGIKYSGSLFRALGLGGLAEGSLFRITKRTDGMVWLQQVNDHEAALQDGLFIIFKRKPEGLAVKGVTTYFTEELINYGVSSRKFIESEIKRALDAVLEAK